MQDNPTIVRRFVDEVINHGRMDLAAQFVWEDVVEQVPLPGQGPGLEGLKDILRGMRAAFPDLDFVITEQIADGDKVASRFEWTGTHRQEFFGVPATGRPVRVWGVVIDRLEAGRIKDTRIIMDGLGLMMQLGVIPPPGACPRRNRLAAAADAPYNPRMTLLRAVPLALALATLAAAQQAVTFLIQELDPIYGQGRLVGSSRS
jgi:steroid delta-isomerase-like uncharacterized protein